MRKLFFTSMAFAGGAVFGLALAAVVLLGLASSGTTGPVPAAGATGEPDVTVTVSERYINALVVKQFGSTAGYRNLHVNLGSEGVIALTGEANVGGFWLPVSATGRILADGGGIKVKVDETRVGTIPVNLDLSEIVEKPIAAAARNLLPLDHYRVSGVTTSGGNVVIGLVER